MTVNIKVKGYLDGSPLYIAIERPLYHIPQQIYYYDNTHVNLGSATVGWAADIEPETLYIMISSSCVYFSSWPCL